MRFKFHFLFAFFSLLFLFYPGDSDIFKTFAFNRKIFSDEKKLPILKINSIAYLKQNPYPQLSAEGIYILDLPSFSPVYEKNAHQKFSPASTTKIMTALVAYDIYKPDQIITIKNINTEGQAMGLVAGEKISIENLLYGTLVYSGNDAAFTLAENYGLDKFVALMNEKAKNLKMLDTNFKNPAGLDDFGQYTSPFDLSLAARELLKNKYLAKIVATKEIIISDIDFKYFHKLTNVNKLLGEIQGIGGLKTGYTEDAGENLVSLYKNNNHDLIIVILKSQDRFADTKNAIQWIKDNVLYEDYYSKYSLVTAGT